MNNIEPMAIIGMACKFPKSSSVKEFWERLCNSEDCISEIPKDRWCSRKYYSSDTDLESKSHASEGGFISEDIRLFDNVLFGISEKEAEIMDPQQRILLEVSWELFEHAGVPIDDLRETLTGVYIGAFCMDNQLQRLSVYSRHLIDAFTATSSSLTLLSNRLSHFYNLIGPSIAIDTACSSSLVAVHLACQAINNGDCQQAIVGGVNIMMRPEYSIAMSKGRFLSKDNRCKAFDNSADGYVRSEGAGLIMLKPLSKAQSDNDRIWAIIKGTGVNHDGYTKDGITRPNSNSQYKLIKKVCKSGKIKTQEIGYIEAHATGTQAGDAVELNAINNALKGITRKNRCWVGALKTNIGHLEAASGVASMIKASLVMKNRLLPANLHLININKEINIKDSCLKFPNKLSKINDPATLKASINSFGYGGSNANIVIQEYSQKIRTNTNRTDGDLYLLPISGKSEKDLNKCFTALRKHLDNNSTNINDLIYTYSKRKNHFKYRTTIIAKSINSIKHKLKKSVDINHYYGSAKYNNVSPVFVFSGMGTQWNGMAQALAKKYVRFRQYFHNIINLISNYSGLDKTLLINNSLNDSISNNCEYIQPTIFAIQCALARFYIDLGIKPNCVIGHSAGEAAAAYISEKLTLDDAIKVVVERSRLQQKVSGTGRMIAIALSKSDVEKIIKEHNLKDIWIAAENSRTSTVVAIANEILKDFLDLLPPQCRRKVLQGDIPYHSAVMDNVKNELVRKLYGLKSNKEKYKFHSTAFDKIEDSELNAQYWWGNVRNEVKFKDKIEQLINLNNIHYLEISPNPVLINNINEILGDNNKKGMLISSLKKDNELESFLTSISILYCTNSNIKWDYLINEGNLITTPGHSMTKKLLWKESHNSVLDRIGNQKLPNYTIYSQYKPFDSQLIEINEKYYPWISHHRFEKTIVFPASAFI